MATLAEALSHGRALHESGDWRVHVDPERGVEVQYMMVHVSPMTFMWQRPSEIYAREMPQDGWNLTDDPNPGEDEVYDLHPDMSKERL